MPHDLIVTRFAPSPTGLLHKGHAYSALTAFSLARKNHGRFLLRIEDIDPVRCRAENTEQIFCDLDWLGLEWEQPVRVQSQHRSDYDRVARSLHQRQLLYPCFCSRNDVLREAERAGYAPHGGDGPIYPGTCRKLSDDERSSRIAGSEGYCLRLDLNRALEKVGSNLTWTDTYHGIQIAKPELLGDAILVRKDIGTSYHLAVVTDDANQGITDIVRGIDLFDSTHLHRLLQAVLGFPAPTYHHHPLLIDADGNRLAKRDSSITLKSLRETGLSAAALRDELGIEL